ncbi:MAG: TraR/DksA family transcriptional regulator [Desulfuromonadales bacterium]|nr:TraR/DksA family transcriptional regulator [Desulfuromonadales bacterium]
MEEQQLAAARERLLQLRKEVLLEVNESLAAAKELGQDGVADIGDMSANTYHRDVLLNLNEVQRQKIRDIDAALERVGLGKYGICLRCEEQIEPRRMQVRPFSRYCIDCKTEIEKFGE